MTKAEILQELPKLKPEDRRHILELLCELQDRDLANGVEPTDAEKALLDQELDDYQKNPGSGANWDEVQARLMQQRSR